jgi:hypothetical protein
MEPELWGGRYGGGGTHPHRAPCRPRHMVSCPPNQSTALASACLRCRRGARNSRVILDRPDDAQFATSVVIRLGTSPTGMTALTVLLSVSMAVTDLMAAFEM